MYALLLGALLAAAPAPSAAPVPAADSLLCEIHIAEGGATGGDARRCTVTIPPGRAVRACTEADVAGKRCRARKQGAGYAASIVERGGASCSLSKKRTDWTGGVTLKMSRKSARPGASCRLVVALR